MTVIVHRSEVDRDHYDDVGSWDVLEGGVLVLYRQGAGPKIAYGPGVWATVEWIPE